jgi:hypothetical protein
MLHRMLMMMALVAMVLFPMFIPSAFAHHSVAACREDEVELRGIVTEFVWRNPHVMVVWNVKDDRGKVVEWTGELSSVTSMLAYGLTKNSLKPGDDVIFTVRPSKAGTPVSVISSMIKADGTVVIRKCYDERRDPHRAVCQSN